MNNQRFIDEHKEIFSEFEEILTRLKARQDAKTLNDLKKTLNKFFKGTNCREILYTRNTDKLFFGMAVIPYMKPEVANKIISTDDQIMIEEYYLELDSKLFSPFLGLNAKELTAVLLHEVGHMVNDASPIDKLRKNLDAYLAITKSTVKLTYNVHYQEVLLFGIKDALRKLTSIFYHDDDEPIADSFVVMCGYGDQLESALNKIASNSYKLNRDVDNKLIVMSWILRVYSDVKLRRIMAIKSLQKGRHLTGSQLEKREMYNLEGELKSIDDDALLEAQSSGPKSKFSKMLADYTKRNLRQYEDDYYDYALRTKNVTTEYDALSLMHNINTRIGIIEDYLETEDDISEAQFKRLNTLLDKFKKLRDILSNKNIYGSDYTRLYITYPDIIDNRRS